MVTHQSAAFIPSAWRRIDGQVLFLVAYIALDWASFLAPLQGLNLTPWNPAPALAVIFLLRRGWLALPAVVLAIGLSELLVRGPRSDIEILMPTWLMLASAYAGLAWLLRRVMPDDGLFSTPAELFRWALWLALGTLAIALLYVTTLLATGLLDAKHWYLGVLRFWIGDGVGMFIAMPLFWWLRNSTSRRHFLDAIGNWEALAYVVLTILALWIAFDLGARAHYRYFYVLFLPVVWAATRHGLAGAVLCLSGLQVGMVIYGAHQEASGLSLLEIQVRALLLASVGFVIGTAIDEQRRYAADLRQSMRLAVAGEMAGALAHEVNQPLTALTAYASACAQICRDGADTRLGDLLRRLNDEAVRLANVVRRLRDFLRTGETHLELCTARELIEDACMRYRDRACPEGLTLAVEPIPDVRLYVDRLQIGVVLRNLLQNAGEALLALMPSGAVTASGEVRVASRVEQDHLIVDILDQGIGIDPDFAARVFEPFATTKSSGLGLGLAISRAIAEAHGGSLMLCADFLNSVQRRGACFRFVLPLDAGEEPMHG